MSFGDGFIDRFVRVGQGAQESRRASVEPRHWSSPSKKSSTRVWADPAQPAGDLSAHDVSEVSLGLSYEEVETEVRERLPWRYFCRLSLMDTVPDATTLIKLNQRFGEKRVANLNKQLVGHLVKHRAIKPRRIRIDSTTLEAHIAYPIDIGILHQAVRTLSRRASSLGQKIVSHVRATKKALARWGASSKAKLKKRKAQGKKILKKVAQLAGDTLAQSRRFSNKNADSQRKNAASFGDFIAVRS